METYTHKTKGGEYRIISHAIYKTNNVDSEVVVYINFEGEMFVRDLKDFQEKFIKIDIC